jgi:hypothetical protein
LNVVAPLQGDSEAVHRARREYLYIDGHVADSLDVLKNNSKEPSRHEPATGRVVLSCEGVRKSFGLRVVQDEQRLQLEEARSSGCSGRTGRERRA